MTNQKPAPPQAESTSEEKGGPFNLWLVAGAIGLAAFVAAAKLGALAARPSSESGAVLSALRIPALIVATPIVLSLVAYHLGGRSRRAARITFGAVLAVSFAGCVAWAIHGATHSRNSFDSNGNGKTATVAVKPGSVLPAGPGALPNDDPVARASQKLTEEIKAQAIAFQTAVQAWAEDGAFDYSSIHTSEDLERREKLRAEALAQAEASMSSLQKARERMQELLKEESAPPEAAEHFLTGFDDSFGRQQPMVLQLRSLDADLLRLAGQMNSALAKQWGHWSWDATKKEFVFDSTVPPAAAEEILKLDADAKKMGRDQAELARDFGQRAAAGGTAPAP